MENARYQLAVFQVISGQRRFIFVKASVDLVHAIPRIIDRFPFAEQLSRHRLQRERGKTPESRFQRVDAVDNQTTIRLREKHAVFETVLAPLKLAIAAPEDQRNAIAFGVFLQDAQIKLHHVPADEHIGIVSGKPLIQFFE
ncbi:hypothetical protein D3C78_1007490 [compost metagenome]